MHQFVHVVVVVVVVVVVSLLFSNALRCVILTAHSRNGDLHW